MRIVLTGGIACGKSLVAKFLRELGVRVLDADEVVHELEGPGGTAVPAIVARFGASILAPDGSVARARLADTVFGGARENARKDLEAILHPLVRQRLLAWLEATPAGKEIRVVVIPLLFESHWESDYDTIIAVSATEDRQIDRMMRTRGYTRAQAKARLEAQMSAAAKAARADWTIHNDESPEELKARVRECIDWLSGRMEKRDEHRRQYGS